MNGEHCATITGQVVDQLGSRFRARATADTCQIDTPFLYPDNTPISVSVTTLDGSRAVLSDLGEAADYAFVNGVGPSVLREQMTAVERRFELNVTGQELSIESDMKDLGSGLAKLVNGIQDVSYLIYRRSTRRPRSGFRDEVERYLAMNRYPYESRVTIAGVTGPRTVDYRLQGRSSGRQLYLMTFEPTATAATLSRAKVIAYDVGDILAVAHDDPIRLAVILDDRQARLTTPAGPETRLILASTEAEVILWDRRDRIADLIAA